MAVFNGWFSTVADASGMGESGEQGSPAHLSHGFTSPSLARARHSSQDARSNSPAGTTGKDITESDTSQQNQVSVTGYII